MVPPKLKICGITNLADARYCAGAGADFLGFIQHPSSPRYIDPREARQIIDWVYGTEPVGVFVNASADEISEISTTAAFSRVQLHGEETPEVCAAVEFPLIKAFRVRASDTADTLKAAFEPYRPHVEAFLLDTYHEALHGGTGQTFDWTLAAELAREFPIILAGGLNADNVEEAVRTVRPFGIDVASSVEETPGRKDFDKLATFIERFHNAIGSPEPS